MSHRTEFEAAATNVLTVSFDAPYWAGVWLQETGSPFPLLMDPDRAAYRAYGLTSSWLRTWGPATLWYYGKAILQGRQTFGKRGDPHQLGGDFVIDHSGIIRLAYASRDPTDRPSVAEILDVVGRN